MHVYNYTDYMYVCAERDRERELLEQFMIGCEMPGAPPLFGREKCYRRERERERAF